MTELALFRKIQGGKPSYFVTVAKKLLPPADRFTVTLVSPETWRTGKSRYEHMAKKKGKAQIHGSLKITINKELVQALGLSKSSPVWIRILPYTEKPPAVPKTPYIMKPVKVHTDKSSLFFVISESQINYLREIKPGNNLHIYVYLGSTVIDYIKRPIYVKKDRLYKVLLPMSLFYGLVRVHDTILVKIETTDKPEEYYYTS